MNEDLQVGSERLARVVQPKWPENTPHRLTQIIAADLGVSRLVDFVQRAIRGNAPRRLARAVLRDWLIGGGEVSTTSLTTSLLKEMDTLREEVEGLKKQIAERKYWELHERYPPDTALGKMSKEDKARLPRDLGSIKETTC